MTSQQDIDNQTTEANVKPPYAGIFARELSAQRRAYKVQPKTLAEYLGIPLSYLQRIEKRLEPPLTVEQISKVCHLFGCTPEGLFSTAYADLLWRVLELQREYKDDERTLEEIEPGLQKQFEETHRVLEVLKRVQTERRKHTGKPKEVVAI